MAARRSSGCPPGCAGAFVTGATMANFTALAAARHAVLARAGLGRRGRRPVRRAADHGRGRRGGAPDADQGARAARASGATALVRVPVDGQGRMRADALPPLSRPDDRLRAGRQRQHRRLRPARGDRRARARGRRLGARRRRVRPVGGGGAGARAPRWPASELADSWATDAHKWLNVPYDSGLAFVRDADGAARGDGRDGRVPAGAERRAQPVRLHARALAPRARRRGLGGAALARAARGWPSWSSAAAGTRRRFAEGLARGRLRDPQRRRAEPGAGLVRRRRPPRSA